MFSDGIRELPGPHLRARIVPVPEERICDIVHTLLLTEPTPEHAESLDVVIPTGCRLIHGSIERHRVAFCIPNDPDLHVKEAARSLLAGGSHDAYLKSSFREQPSQRANVVASNLVRDVLLETIAEQRGEPGLAEVIVVAGQNWQSLRPNARTGRQPHASAVLHQSGDTARSDSKRGR